MPRVSVIVPTHNRLELLKAALESVERQHFRDFEVIVVNDGSTDGTADWVKNSNVTGIDLATPGLGAAAARNRAINAARGEIIAFLDDDDRWRPAYLDKQVAQLDAHPEASAAITGHVETYASGRSSQPLLDPAFPYPNFLSQLLAECPIHTLSIVACRRTAFDRIGLFNESLRIVHDLDWYVRLTQAGGQFVVTPDVLVEHAVPGGLVTKHRDWYHEEQSVHQNCIEPSVRVARELFFARTALANGDIPFALARAAAGFAKSPRIATSMIARRVHQRRQSAKMEEAQ